MKYSYHAIALHCLRGAARCAAHARRYVGQCRQEWLTLMRADMQHASAFEALHVARGGRGWDDAAGP